MSRIEKDRSYFVVVLLFAFFLLSGAIISCSTVNGPRPREELPAIVATGLKVTRHDEAGNVTVKIDSSRAEYHDGNQVGTAFEVDLWFYNEDGEEVLYLTADEIDFNFRTGDLDVRGSIRGEESGGTTFETEHAHWNDETGILTGDSEIYAERENGRFSAESFTYDSEKAEFVFRKVSFEVDLPKVEE